MWAHMNLWLDSQERTKPWKATLNFLITSLPAGTSLSPGLQMFTGRRERPRFVMLWDSNDALGIACQSLIISHVQSANLVMLSLHCDE